MMSSDKIHALLPIFNWSWWLVWLFTFTLGWVMIITIKKFEPLGWERAYWRSGIYGDMFLPLAIASSVTVLRNFDGTNAWYTQRWWNWLVLVTGFLLIITLEAASKYTLKQELMPSKLWHTLIAFPLMFYLGVMTAAPLIVAHKPAWAFVLAIAGYSLWFATFVFDLVRPPDFTKTH